MSQSTEDQLRQIAEQLGRLQRHVAHLEAEVKCVILYEALPYSNEDNDAAVQDVGFNEEVEDALHQNHLFKVSQILNLGKRWLDNAPRIGAGRAEEIKIHLAGMGVALPD